MRISFSNVDRAKKAAKALASVANGVRLCDAQRAIAKLTGYRDWHDLVKSRKAEPTHTLAPIPQGAEFHQKIIALTPVLSAELGLPWSEALYALLHSYLPGIQVNHARDYEAIWLKLLKQKENIQGAKHSPGSVVKIKSPGRMGNPAILKKFGRSTYLVTHRSVNTCVADFEITIPRKPLPLFIPGRLKLAYGYWTEADDSKVLFSRDYKPLWRLVDGRKPERLQPWLWINYVEQKWFWDDTNTPWYSPRRLQEEERRLHEFGIVALPKLADILPDIVFNRTAKDVSSAVDLMARRDNRVGGLRD